MSIRVFYLDDVHINMTDISECYVKEPNLPPLTKLLSSASCLACSVDSASDLVWVSPCITDLIPDTTV